MRKLLTLLLLSFLVGCGRGRAEPSPQSEPQSATTTPTTESKAEAKLSPQEHEKTAGGEPLLFRPARLDDQTPLVHVKADPARYLGVPIVTWGSLTLSDYYTRHFRPGDGLFRFPRVGHDCRRQQRGKCPTLLAPDHRNENHRTISEVRGEIRQRRPSRREGKGWRRPLSYGRPGRGLDNWS